MFDFLQNGRKLSHQTIENNKVYLYSYSGFILTDAFLAQLCADPYLKAQTILIFKDWLNVFEIYGFIPDYFSPEEMKQKGFYSHNYTTGLFDVPSVVWIPKKYHLSCLFANYNLVVQLLNSNCRRLFLYIFDNAYQFKELFELYKNKFREQIDTLIFLSSEDRKKMYFYFTNLELLVKNSSNMYDIEKGIEFLIILFSPEKVIMQEIKNVNNKTTTKLLTYPTSFFSNHSKKPFWKELCEDKNELSLRNLQQLQRVVGERDNFNKQELCKKAKQIPDFIEYIRQLFEQTTGNFSLEATFTVVNINGELIQKTLHNFLYGSNLSDLVDLVFSINMTKMFSGEYLHLRAPTDPIFNSYLCIYPAMFIPNDYPTLKKNWRTEKISDETLSEYFKLLYQIPPTHSGQYLLKNLYWGIQKIIDYFTAKLPSPTREFTRLVFQKYPVDAFYAMSIMHSQQQEEENNSVTIRPEILWNVDFSPEMIELYDNNTELLNKTIFFDMEELLYSLMKNDNISHLTVSRTLDCYKHQDQKTAISKVLKKSLHGIPLEKLQILFKKASELQVENYKPFLLILKNLLDPNILVYVIENGYFRENDTLNIFNQKDEKNIITLFYIITLLNIEDDFNKKSGKNLEFFIPEKSLSKDELLKIVAESKTHKIIPFQYIQKDAETKVGCVNWNKIRSVLVHATNSMLKLRMAAYFLTRRRVDIFNLNSQQLCKVIQQSTYSSEWYNAQDKYLSSLSEFDRQIITWYSYHGDRLMNSILRNGRKGFDNLKGAFKTMTKHPYIDIVASDDEIYDRILQLTQRLQQIILNAPKLEKDIVVFRGSLSVDHVLASPEYKYISKSFESTSTDYDAAYDTFSNNVALFSITIPKGFPCLTMLKFTKVVFENEILLPYNTEYIIENIQNDVAITNDKNQAIFSLRYLIDLKVTPQQKRKREESNELPLLKKARNV